MDLPIERAKETSQENDFSYDGKSIDEVVEAIERRMIETALRKASGNNKGRLRPFPLVTNFVNRLPVAFWRVPTALQKS